MRDWQKAAIVLSALAAGIFYLSRPQTEEEKRRHARLIAREREQRQSASR